MSIYDKSSLVLIPSGTKTGKVYSQKPVSGDGDFTFTRSSAATRVNADGNIEKETQNLILQSNQLNTTWGAQGTIVGSQADKDGGTSAWSFTPAGATSGFFQNITTGGVQTFSVYVKKNATYGIRVYMFGSLNAATFFDLNNGAVASSTSGVVDASIEAYNSDWWRVSVTCNSTLSQVTLYSTDNASTQVVGTITIQDAQLEQGLVARDVITTTTTAVEGGITDNVPRLDYTDSSCPALLLEPQRTNAIINSEYLLGYYSSNTTITQNYGISPEGVKNSARIQFTGSGYISFSVATYANEVTSMYVKGVAGEILRFGKGANVAQGALYTLTGDWQRIVYDTGSASIFFIISNFNGANVTDFEVYGLQHEEGSYATSYIPTYGSSVTRVGETCVDAGNASTFNSTEGVLYAEISGLANGGVDRSIALSDGSTSNYLRITLHANSNRIAFYSNKGVNYNNYDFSQTDDLKIAFQYKANDWKVYINGVLETQLSALTFSPNTLSDLSFNLSNFTPFYGNAKQVLYFPTALSDEELAVLTTI